MDNKRIVIDVGTGLTKAGLAGSQSPSYIGPTIYGVPIYRKHRFELDQKQIYYGKDAIKRGCLLSLHYPVEYGIVLEWDTIAQYLEDIFSNKLGLKDTKGSSVLFAQPTINTKTNQENLLEIMFEKEEAGNLSFMPQGLLSLYALGKASGLVVDCGEGSTSVTPIFEGYTLIQGYSRLDFGGRDLNDFLNDLLWTTKRIKLITSAEREYLRYIKEKQCYIPASTTLSEREDEEEETEITLPDGNKITIGIEKSMVGEAVFNPGIVNSSEIPGLVNLVEGAIQKCDIDVRKDLYSNVVLAGGCTMFRGFADRMNDELEGIFGARTGIDAREDRKYLQWVGGSVIANLESFKNQWISKEEYEESGKSILTQRCFI